MTKELRRLGELAFSDTGPAPGSTDYTTVVLIHGVGWHSTNFQRLQPFAAQYNTRLILVNRRDYPGSEPYTDTERAQLAAAKTAPDAEAVSLFEDYMRDRAHEVFDFLGAFVKQECIPPRQAHSGGIVLCTWSFGATLMTALLANLASLPSNEVHLTEYIRRTVLYDPPYHSLGYPTPPDPYRPFSDETIPPADRAKAFAVWVSGYYTHGVTEQAFERRTADVEPPPTIATMTPEEIQACFSTGPAGPGGSDLETMNLGFAKGRNARMRERAFYLEHKPTAGASNWANVPLRYVWCDRSAYVMPWGASCLCSELENAKKSGRRMRNISVVCLPGANHFLHWDDPERLFCALLAEDDEIASS